MKATIYKLLSLFVLFALIGCQDTESSKSENNTEELKTEEHIVITQQQFEQAKMALGQIEQKAFPNRIEVSGFIDVPPENRALVTSPLGGYIKNISLIEGDVVKKGQLLARLENPEFISLQQEFLEIHEQLNYLRAEYERQQRLKEENITSEKSFLKSESDYKFALARATGLEKQLRLLNLSPANVKAGNISSVAPLYAPISGSISEVNVSKGSFVSAADPILEIIDNDHIHLELKVFEKNIMQIEKGQAISFTVPEASNQIYDATVHLVGSAIGEQRTITVHGHLTDESQGNFLTGMFVQAAIITKSEQADALPTQAIIASEGSNFVIILDKTEDNKFYLKQHEVTVVNSWQGYSQVILSKEIEKSARFLTAGGFALIGN